MARAAVFPPPYNPYFSVCYCSRSWPPRLSLHVMALSNWRSQAQRISIKQDSSFQMWTRRRYRFVFASDLRKAWSPLGGLPARLSQIAVLLALASDESGAFDIAYRVGISRFLSDPTRDRLGIDYVSYLNELDDYNYKRVPRGANTHIKPPSLPRVDLIAIIAHSHPPGREAGPRRRGRESRGMVRKDKRTRLIAKPQPPPPPLHRGNRAFSAVVLV